VSHKIAREGRDGGTTQGIDVHGKRRENGTVKDKGRDTNQK